jgi:hypothetical protein
MDVVTYQNGGGVIAIQQVAERLVFWPFATGSIRASYSRIHIEKPNAPFLFQLKDTLDQYRAGLKHAIERGWIGLHESGTFIRTLKPMQTSSPDRVQLEEKTTPLSRGARWRSRQRRDALEEALSAVRNGTCGSALGC